MSLQEMLGPRTAAVSTREDHEDVPLFPEEEAYIARAVPARRLEFATGRWCARQALLRLGRTPEVIGIGSQGEPIWPVGTTGSITHCEGFRAAAVGDLRHHEAIGIDAEPDAPLPTGILDVVSGADERRRLRRVEAPHPDRLLFCAKEATYKAWYTLARRPLDFDEGEVTVDNDGTFVCRITSPEHRPPTHPGRFFEGRWGSSEGVILATVVVPGTAPTAPGHA